jgi:hypothetical protein
VSSSEEDVTKTNTSADKRKVPAGYDAEDGGASFAESIAPNRIRSNAPEQADPSVVDRAAPVVPLTGGRGHKCPPPAIRRNQPLPSADQVMTQVELPPYHRPRNPLDVIIVEIIFGCLFEAFQHISQAVVAGASTDDSTRPQKKVCQPSLRKLLVPR